MSDSANESAAAEAVPPMSVSIEAAAPSRATSTDPMLPVSESVEQQPETPAQAVVPESTPAAKPDKVSGSTTGLVNITADGKHEDFHYPPQLLVHSSAEFNFMPGKYVPYSGTVHSHVSPLHHTHHTPTHHQDQDGHSPSHDQQQPQPGSQPETPAPQQQDEAEKTDNPFALRLPGHHEEHHQSPHGRHNEFHRKTKIHLTHEISRTCVFEMIGYNTHGQTMGLREGTPVECDDPKLAEEVVDEDEFCCFCFPVPNYKETKSIKVHIWTKHGHDGLVAADALRPLPKEKQEEMDFIPSTPSGSP